MKLPRRQFLHLAAGAAILPAVSRVAWAQTYPSRPVRIIVTFAAGATTDVHARLHGQWLSERLGQPFIVENRPGGGGTLGAAEAIRSSPDGYTLFLLTASHAINASLYEKLPYNIVHDTTPIASFYKGNYVMVVNPSLPVRSVAEFIAYAKASPGKVRRHACGFKLANDGVDTRALQAYLGHKSIQHTVRYTELAPTRFKGFWRD